MKTEVTNDKSLVDREADEQYTAQPSNDEETDVNRERSTVTGRRISSSTEIATNIHEETRSVKEETSDTDEVSQKNESEPDLTAPAELPQAILLMEKIDDIEDGTGTSPNTINTSAASNIVANNTPQLRDPLVNPIEQHIDETCVNDIDGFSPVPTSFPEEPRYVDDEVEMWQITGQSAKVGLTFDFAATAERDEKGSVVSVEEAADEVLIDDGRTTDSDGDEDENYDKERLSSIYDFVGSDSDASSMNAPVMLV